MVTPSPSIFIDHLMLSLRFCLGCQDTRRLGCAVITLAVGTVSFPDAVALAGDKVLRRGRAQWKPQRAVAARGQVRACGGGGGRRAEGGPVLRGVLRGLVQGRGGRCSAGSGVFSTGFRFTWTREHAHIRN